MPYITRERRKFLHDGMTPQNAGDLNFLLTRTALRYLDTHGKSYSTINEIVGALECAKQEFYRRLAAPYEDTKIETNGDVYP